MAVPGFIGGKHTEENGQRLREKALGRVGSDEGVEEEGGSASTEGEKQVGLLQLGSGGVGAEELGSDEVVAGNAEFDGFSVELREGLEVLRRTAGVE